MLQSASLAPAPCKVLEGIPAMHSHGCAFAKPMKPSYFNCNLLKPPPPSTPNSALVANDKETATETFKGFN